MEQCDIHVIFFREEKNYLKMKWKTRMHFATTTRTNFLHKFIINIVSDRQMFRSVNSNYFLNRNFDEELVYPWYFFKWVKRKVIISVHKIRNFPRVFISSCRKKLEKLCIWFIKLTKSEKYIPKTVAKMLRSISILKLSNMVLISFTTLNRKF